MSQGTSSLAPWYNFLSRWSLFFVIAYGGLVVGFITLILPASQHNSLPAEYFELVAASREPILYRLIIACDVGASLAMGGLFAAFAGLLRLYTPIRSLFIALMGSGMFVGFLGACLRLAGTAQLAARYLAGSAQQQGVIVQSYDSLLRIINITFSSGGLLQGIAMVLIASAARYLPSLPRWSTLLIGLSGFLVLVKGIIELTTGADLGPLGLLSGLILSIALCSIAIRYWKETPPLVEVNAESQ